MKFEEMNIDDVIKALIDDEPELAKHEADLRRSFAEMKAGQFTRKTEIRALPIVETRNKVGLSQNKFAERLGISVNTLRSWEQGQRKPSGAAATLLMLLNKRPELVAELN